MGKNICLNCGYFLNCKNASEEMIKCNKFTKIYKNVTEEENKAIIFEKKYCNNCENKNTLNCEIRKKINGKWSCIFFQKKGGKNDTNI